MSFSPLEVLTTPAGTAVRVPLNFFLNHVLPPLQHSFSISKALQTLLTTGKRSSAHKPITLKKRWKGFAKDPAEADRPGDRSFVYVENAVQAIIKAAGSKETEVTFKNNPEPIMENHRRV